MRAHALWAAVAAVVALVASCSGNSGTLGVGADAGEGGTGGDCGLPGKSCCNGIACAAGLTCSPPGICTTTGGSSGGSGSGSGGGSGGSSSGASSGGSSGSSSAGGGLPCPAGLQCNVACSGGGTTSISGAVYDPAGKNPLYDITVYVPESDLQPLPKGVPTGADACSCPALYKSGLYLSTRTTADGTFRLKNAPVGVAVPLVIQSGKWRRMVHVNVTACQDNVQPDKSLALPSTVSQPGDSMPDIAVSTGGADTLECLFHRVGLPTTEYVAGTGTSGHVHVFSGGNAAGGTGTTGIPETPAMPGAPSSPAVLWDKQADLMPYDLVFLSCEGGETYSANPQVLEQYLNAGGRVFGNHFHYAWFAGPLSSGQAYSAPPDWGSNLATWTANGIGTGAQANGTIVQTLNGSTSPFPKGVALATWLAKVNALGINGAPANELPILQPRFNAQVSASDKPSQPWVLDDMTHDAMLFSFNTPVGAPKACGRAVYGDVHVSGASTDTPPPPGGCASTDLSAQEKALEFALFDLSSCVLPDSATPPPTGP